MSDLYELEHSENKLAGAEVVSARCDCYEVQLPVVGKAHQRIIRDEKQKENSLDLFGKYWEKLDLSRNGAEIREIDYITAKRIILEYEWLGTMPSGFKFGWGLYLDGACAAVECFTDSKAGSMYSLYNEPAVCLARGACVHWAPSWSASFLISKTIKMIDANKYGYVIAYSDTDAGEIGTVYQACNWFCIGVVANTYWESPIKKRFDMRHHRDRSKIKVNGKSKVINNAHLEEKEKMLRDGWEYKTGGIRYRYAQALGSGREYRKRLEQLKKNAIIYPKRAVEVSKEICLVTNEEGAGQFRDTALNSNLCGEGN